MPTMTHPGLPSEDQSAGSGERRLEERWGVHLEEMFVDADADGLRSHLDANPDVSGVVMVAPTTDGVNHRVAAFVRPGLLDPCRDSFAAWVDEKLARYLEHGPEPDGWQRRTSDGGWQLWARLVEL